MPGDHVSWANLAVAYVEQARVTGLFSYYDKADEAAARSFSIEPDDNFTALAARAAIDAARHDFSGALASAQEALAINPRDLGALAIRVDALNELGSYDDQLRALRIADRRQPSTAIAARYSYAYELRGDLDRAGDILRRAAASGTRADQAYVLTLRADILRKQDGLRAAGRDLATRVAGRARPSARPRLLGPSADGARRSRGCRARPGRTSSPSNPCPSTSPSSASSSNTSDGPRRPMPSSPSSGPRSRCSRPAAWTPTSRPHCSRPTTGRPEHALTQARAEWERRTSVHVADALAWALHRTGRDAEALPIARAATRLGSPEARFWIHRGTIESALGMTTEARPHLRRGLGTDPGMSPWQRDQARTTLSRIEGTR